MANVMTFFPASIIVQKYNMQWLQYVLHDEVILIFLGLKVKHV